MHRLSVISAQKHTEKIVVTAAVFNVSFECPVKLGEIVTINTKITRTFKTSLEVHAMAWTKNVLEKRHCKCGEAYYTFVTLKSDGNNALIPPVVPETEEEKAQFKLALKRKKFNLLWMKQRKEREKA